MNISTRVAVDVDVESTHKESVAKHQRRKIFGECPRGKTLSRPKALKLKAAIERINLIDNLQAPSEPNRRKTAKVGWMSNRPRLLCKATCKTKYGKTVQYSVYNTDEGLEIQGPDLRRFRCNASIKNCEDAKIEIANRFDVRVISVTNHA
jgi:hypothetical protein